MIRSLKVFLLLTILCTACLVQAQQVSGPVTFNEFISQQLDYDDTYFVPADTGFDGDVRAIGIYNGDLIVGGYFFTADGFTTNRVAGWNGSNWYNMLGFPAGNPIYWFHEFEGDLYAGQHLGRLNSWDGSAWTAHLPHLGNGWGPLWALATFDNELIVGGAFEYDPAQPSYIAQWNGAGWDTVGTGINWNVNALHVYNGALIAGGYFKTSDGSVNDRIAQWDGLNWTALGTGMPDGGVRALTTYDGELIAGGNFTSAGGANAMSIARWDGSSWNTLGDGLDGWVEALIVFDNKLIAGGRFENSGSTPTAFVASWDGSSWSAIGSGFDDDVYALGEYNGYLIAGGAFTDAGGYIALWDNSTWRPVSDIVLGISDGITSQLPSSFSLNQNYPNPFNPETVIEYNLARRANTQIEIINISGQTVKSLMSQSMPAGDHSISWDGTNDAGQKVSSGTYFYRLTVDNRTESKKMILLK